MYFTDDSLLPENQDLLDHQVPVAVKGRNGCPGDFPPRMMIVTTMTSAA